MGASSTRHRGDEAHVTVDQPSLTRSRNPVAGQQQRLARATVPDRPYPLLAVLALLTGQELRPENEIFHSTLDLRNTALPGSSMSGPRRTG